ncbi:hypothetical protein CSOJ01_10587 [Colletotrichum sojae]|uniref:T6SS Phospholipase effector Tle1-like catalytic domain-containing protein n=1 Tax=Colletotrichum sojae TaxID=2175907 RepID=A0A8H6J0F5_9PEZI|nr:hypothetical protein CSOJ01_10587 [Colletotrichum sojae]
MNTQLSFNRIVVCVDGTWYNSDGQEGKQHIDTRHHSASRKLRRLTCKIRCYINGIGTEKSKPDKFNDGITGDGCAEQIREVFTYCCKQINSGQDEVWLFGFSRGAYVIRVVAALLHQLTLKNTPERTNTTVCKRLKNLAMHKSASKGTTNGQEQENGQAPPRIKFLGLFDTVKQISAEAELDVDITDTSFIEHARHALALNEKRKFFPILHTSNRAMPVPGQARGETTWRPGSPPGLATSMASTDAAPEAEPEPWTFQYSNKVKVTMFDLRSSHRHGSLQSIPRNKLRKKKDGEQPEPRHVVMINQGLSDELSLGRREVFGSDNFGTLQGYRSDSSSGIIIHPSVYFLLDTYATLGIRKALEEFLTHLERFREKANQHPGIIIHDSEGYQAGNCKEVTAFKRFLRSRPNNSEARKNLHALWICIETDTDRPVQFALASVLKEVAAIAPTTPIIVVGAKKDKYLRLHGDEPTVEMAENNPTVSFLHEGELLLNRQTIFETQFESSKDTHPFWSKLDVKFAFVSKDDEDSIRSLIRLTMESLNDSEVLDALGRAQVLDIESKIDQAVERTLKLLKAAVGSATAWTGLVVTNVVAASTISRFLCEEIAHGCFGIPKANAADVDTILAGIVWKNLAPFMAQSLARSTMIWGGVACLTFFTLVGGIPLAAAAPLLEAPAAARMIIKCACDLILILDKVDVDEGGVKIQKLRRRAVHGKINELIPLISSLCLDAYKEKTVSKYREGIRDILTKYKFQITVGAAQDSDDDNTGENSTDTEPASDPEDREDIDQFLSGPIDSSDHVFLLSGGFVCFSYFTAVSSVFSLVMSHQEFARQR